MGKLIVIEGCDGSGKSSVAIGLAKEINGVYYKTPSRLFWDMRLEIEKKKNYNLIFYYYLTGTLHAAQEMEEILQTQHVICDRYYYTTVAYHRCLGVEIPTGLEKLFIQPDYGFLFFANEEVMKKRTANRESTNEYVGPHDLNYDLQNRAFAELKKFELELFDTSYLTADQSVQQILQKIKL